jgi:GNAT superfamily N-acetyltransferase
MPVCDVTVSCPIYDSFRVQQVAGMFDVTLAEKAQEHFKAELPNLEDDWRIGMIVGPSGSGKSTIAREVFADNVYHSSDWPADRAVVDCFGDLPTRRVIELFTAVGFGSPPAWVKPYRVLSAGEQFRCEMARALSRDDGSLIAFDEFTSVVDRTVAKVCSAAIAKGIRNGDIPCRFVAVTCHYDVAEWLEPDWVLDMATSQLDWRRLRRPTIELEIYRCEYATWEMFKRHHYLNASLNRGAQCYLATWNDVPVCFCATLPLVGKKGRRRFTRIVTLPDYQGIGIGMRVVEAVAEIYIAENQRINVTGSHPSLMRHCSRSPLWRTAYVKKAGEGTPDRGYPRCSTALGRARVSFEYLGMFSRDEQRSAYRNATNQK